MKRRYNHYDGTASDTLAGGFVSIMTPAVQ